MTATQTDLQVWKTGKNGNIQFANIKQLEKADPSVYKLMTWQEGFTTQDFNFEYRIGKSKWGLWLSRKPISTEALKAVATAATPEEKDRPTITTTDSYEQAIKEQTGVLRELISAVQILTVAVNNKALT